MTKTELIQALTAFPDSAEVVMVPADTGDRYELAQVHFDEASSMIILTEGAEVEEPNDTDDENNE
jgi:hypothetical protein